MIKKQDRQGVRKPSELERKYDFNQGFASAKSQAASAQRTANEAMAATVALEEKITEVEEQIQSIEFDKTVKHEWKGTTLEITTSSGTSSADLKGKKAKKAIKATREIQAIKAIHPKRALTIGLTMIRQK